jgi:hypothetical protein
LVRGDAIGPAEPTLGRHAFVVTNVVNINDVLDGHVGLDAPSVPTAGRHPR